MDGRKVVRINDLEVANAGESLRIVAADIGVSGLLRRLGLTKLVPALVDRIPRSLIAWDNVERHTLLGVLSLRTLLLALPTGFIEKLMTTDVVSTTPATSAKDVASMIARYDLLAVPVLDDEGKMLGIVTVDDAIDVIIPEKVAKSLPHRVRHPKRQTVATE